MPIKLGEDRKPQGCLLLQMVLKKGRDSRKGKAGGWTGEKLRISLAKMNQKGLGAGRHSGTKVFRDYQNIRACSPKQEKSKRRHLTKK